MSLVSTESLGEGYEIPDDGLSGYCWMAGQLLLAVGRWEVAHQPSDVRRATQSIS